jgi:hypothetical protein
MKTMLVALVVTLVSVATAYSYDNTLIGDQTEVGGFAAATFRYFEMKDEFGILAGGRFAFTVNHALSIGGGAYGTAGKPVLDELPGLEKLEIAYGGLFLEYTYKPHAVFHVSVPVFVGAGQVRFVGGYVDPESGDNSDTFLAVEPEFDLEFNVARVMRVDLGVGYRSISGTELADLSNADLGGINWAITLKVGSF